MRLRGCGVAGFGVGAFAPGAPPLGERGGARAHMHQAKPLGPPALARPVHNSPWKVHTPPTIADWFCASVFVCTVALPCHGGDHDPGSPTRHDRSPARSVLSASATPEVYGS